MGKLLESLNATLLIGLVLAILIAVFPDSGYRAPTGDLVNGVLQWLHVFFGITWIGLLYYFNFVQIPTMPKIPDEQKPAVSKVIAPKALFWFRWGAMATIITGLILATMQGYIGAALSLQKGYHAIGLGMWMGAIMWFNVWFIIWPNQKKVLGIVQAGPEDKARAGKMAGMASRFNTMLSIPMLYCMVAQQNGGL